MVIIYHVDDDDHDYSDDDGDADDCRLGWTLTKCGVSSLVFRQNFPSVISLITTSEAKDGFRRLDSSLELILVGRYIIVMLSAHVEQK